MENRKKRVRLVVAYDGTAYHGWQLQPGAVTVEQVLNEKLTELLGEEIEVIGASRTDSGVHARGNVAVFDTAHRMPAEKISFALNQRLPADIRIQSSEEVAADWHPRKCRCIKTYEYRIINRTMEMPLERLYAYFYHYPLDVEKMRLAAAFLEGEHDFKSFCNVRTQVKDTVRTVYKVEVSSLEQDVISVKITGNGFLYNMVRIIAGTLIAVGAGQRSPEEIPAMLKACDRAAAGPTAPAHGLTLVKMEYPDDAEVRVF